VLCLGCGLALPDSTFQENAPYLWNNYQTPEQFLVSLGDYLIGRLNKRKATFAGDPAMRDRTRVFGSISFEADPPVFTQVRADVAERGAKLGYKTKVSLTYQLVIAQLAEKARSLIAQMKEAEVTTVIFAGDPIMPTYLTQAATDQDYFPEWIITGTVLTDTTTFGRTYDQEQWAHAFGPSHLGQALPHEQTDASKIWRASGNGGVPCQSCNLPWSYFNLIGTMVQQAGPNLNPLTVEKGLFSTPPRGGWEQTGMRNDITLTKFGPGDYSALSDFREVFWDASAVSPIDNQRGAYVNIDEGRRYEAGQLNGEFKVRAKPS
jgi:hypothetical protein